MAHYSQSPSSSSISLFLAILTCFFLHLHLYLHLPSFLPFLLFSFALIPLPSLCLELLYTRFIAVSLQPRISAECQKDETFEDVHCMFSNIGEKLIGQDAALK